MDSIKKEWRIIPAGLRKPAKEQDEIQEEFLKINSILDMEIQEIDLLIEQEKSEDQRVR